MSDVSFEDLVRLMERLRAPGGCPWDREQTYESLRRFVIEEAYEVVDAIDRGDRRELAEELGDHLLQAVFLAQLGREEGSFTIGDSIRAIHDKLVRRHPHVFGDVEAHDADTVLANWEKMKHAEKGERAQSFFEGIPSGLPALMKSVRITEKAARVGFDWKEAHDVFAKIREEIDELEQAIDRDEPSQRISEELGDLFFSIGNLARKLGIDAEHALQDANWKFIRRFEAMEQIAKESGHALDDTSLEELDELWERVKGEER
jgi:tetrapyrrole methylase family protein / MazG family protein